jgi:hypothetical protein
VLTQSSVSPKTIRLILYISEMLKEQKDYFSLRGLFYDFILPRVIVGPIKFTIVAKEEIRELVCMYV